jgi:hypothetical protein
MNDSLPLPEEEFLDLHGGLGDNILKVTFFKNPLEDLRGQQLHLESNQRLPGLKNNLCAPFRATIAPSENEQKQDQSRPKNQE